MKSQLEDDIESAKVEAISIAQLIGATEVVGTTVVYKRKDKTFHIVVHDMTNFKP